MRLPLIDGLALALSTVVCSNVVTERLTPEMPWRCWQSQQARYLQSNY